MQFFIYYSTLLLLYSFAKICCQVFHRTSAICDWNIARITNLNAFHIAKAYFSAHRSFYAGTCRISTYYKLTNTTSFARKVRRQQICYVVLWFGWADHSVSSQPVCHWLSWLAAISLTLSTPRTVACTLVFLQLLKCCPDTVTCVEANENFFVTAIKC